jgi:hypothetical protein
MNLSSFRSFGDILTFSVCQEEALVINHPEVGKIVGIFALAISHGPIGPFF